MYRSRKPDHFPLISETPEQAQVSSDSEGVRVEEEHNYSNTTNNPEQRREPEQLNILRVELIQDTEQQGQKLESWRQHSAKRSCMTSVYTQRSSATQVTWIPECNLQPFPRQSFQKEQKPEQDHTNSEILKKEGFCGSAKCREVSASGTTESPSVNPEWLKNKNKVPSVKKQMTNRKVICSFGRRNKKW